MKWNGIRENRFYMLSATAVSCMILCFAIGTIGSSWNWGGAASIFMLELLVIFVCIKKAFEITHWSDAVYLALFVIVGVLYYWAVKRPYVAFDTWQVFDMSRFIFKDFGYMVNIRQHIINTNYEMAFPPLFPFLMASINVGIDMSVLAGVFLNFNFALLLICEIKKFGQRIHYRGEMAIAALLFVCTYWFRIVFMGGLTQLLGYLLFISIANILVKESYTRKDSFLCIFISGLGLMNRFDFLAAAGLLVLLIPLKELPVLDNRVVFYVKRVFLNTIIMIVVCLPWIIYSIARFHSIFITDNGRRLFNIEDTRPSTYFPADSPALTIFDDFGGWLDAFVHRCWSALHSLLHMIKYYYIPRNTFIFLVILLIIYLIYLICRRREKIINFCKWKKIQKYIDIIIIGTVAAGQEGMYILTGYPDERYHLLFLFVLNVIIFITVVRILKGLREVLKSDLYTGMRRRLLYVFGTAFLLCFVYDGIMLAVSAYPYAFCTYLSGEPTVDTVSLLTGNEEKIDKYLKDVESSCLVVYRLESTIDVPKTMSLVHTSTMLSPSNLSTENVRAYVEDFDVDYLYSSDEGFVDIFKDVLEIRETEVDNLYVISQ